MKQTFLLGILRCYCKAHQLFTILGQICEVSCHLNLHDEDITPSDLYEPGVIIVQSSLSLLTLFATINSAGITPTCKPPSCSPQPFCSSGHPPAPQLAIVLTTQLGVDLLLQHSHKYSLTTSSLEPDDEDQRQHTIVHDNEVQNVPPSIRS